MKRGVPPTALKARTGELTPPGMTARARSKRRWLLSMSMVMNSMAGVVGWQGEVGGYVGAIVFVVVLGLGPEQAVGQHMAHAGAEARVEAAVHVAQRFGGGRDQVGAAGQQRGQRGRQRVARACEHGF